MKQFEIMNADPVHRGLLTPYLQKIRLERVARLIRPVDSVLDIGCGIGCLQEFLPPTVSYVGVDILDDLLDVAGQRCQRGQFIQVDLCQETPDLGRFSTITLVAFIEHISNPEMLLKKLVDNYLAEEGRIILTTPAPWGRIFHEIGAVVGLFSRHAAEEHEKFLGRAELASLSANLGLQMTLFQRFLFGFNQLACLTSIVENSDVL